MSDLETRAAWAEFDDDQRLALERTADVIATCLPGAQVVIAWGMPTFRVGKDNVLSLTGFKKHNSLFPGSEVAKTLAKNLRGFEITKGTIHFDRDKPFPSTLLKKILRARIQEINDSYPRASGDMREYYDNGFLKAEGRMKNGQLHGSWKWFRRDGSIMRSGRFRLGTQIGEWTTYNRDESIAKITSFS